MEVHGRSKFEVTAGTLHTIVYVTNRGTGATLEWKIPKDYCPHLVWILSESTCALGARVIWLQRVMDAFAEELAKLPKSLEDSWRSVVLNPLLQRAYNGVDDFDVQILKHYEKQGWDKFYIHRDVIHPIYMDRWRFARDPNRSQLAHPATNTLVGCSKRFLLRLDTLCLFYKQRQSSPTVNKCSTTGKLSKNRLGMLEDPHRKIC